MFLRSLLLGMMVVFFANCASTQKSADRQVNAVGSCEVSRDLPPLFTIVENNREKIVVELGDIAEKFKLSSGFDYKIYHRGSSEHRTAINTKYEAKETLVKEGNSSARLTRVEVPVTKTGVYIFKIFENEKKPVWIQKVFAIAKADSVLSADEKKSLAEKYAPVVSMHDKEEFFPVSLEYLTNQVEVDPQLAREKFLLTNRKFNGALSFLSSSNTFAFELPYADLLKVLPYYGNAEAVLKPGADATRLKTRYGKNHRTVYYSVFENPKWKEIYINYHFFYTFDPKTGTKDKEALAAHMFDRESMTVVLRSTSKQPLMVFYGAHLPSQLMAELDESGDPKQRWYTGRVYVNWPEVIKNGGRPVPSIALGSHGVFPRKSTYAVYLNEGKIKMLTEPAGGDRLLYPGFAEKEVQKTSNSYSYELRSLGLDQVISDCNDPNRLLAYSGSTVDILGPSNATFPPFTDREEDYNSYSDPNSPMFDMKK